MRHAERACSAEAKAALKKEWDRLRACGTNGCWDEANPRELREVAAEHKRKGAIAHFGRVFDICVSVVWLHHVFARSDLHLIYEQSQRQAADIYTIAFTH